MMLALNVPATFGLMALARPIVALLFERGRFLPADTSATAAALICYAVGLTGYSVVKIASPTFYALGDSRTPVAISAMTVLANAALNLMFVKQFGYRGLALGTSLTALLNAGLLLLLLKRRLGGIDGRHLASVFLRVLVASAVMGAVAWGLDLELHRLVPGRSLAIQILRVSLTIAAALAVLWGAALSLRIAEFTDVVQAIGGQLRRVASR
jgi:putative peptidoglycan lipid II flippase